MEELTSQMASPISSLRDRFSRNIIRNMSASPPAALDINYVIQTTDPETLLHCDNMAKQILTAGNFKGYCQMLRPETRQRINQFYARVDQATAQNV